MKEVKHFLLPSTVSAEVRFIITLNNLTPSPTKSAKKDLNFSQNMLAGHRKEFKHFVLPSTVSAEVRFIITLNNLTPSPPHFGEVSKWKKISKERLELSG